MTWLCKEPGHQQPWYWLQVIPEYSGLSTLDPFYWHGLTLIPAWISNYTHYKVWDEITDTAPNFNVYAVKVWEWISNFIQHFTMHMITYPCWDELTNLRGLKFSILHRNHIFQCMGKIFCMELQRYPMKSHTKYLLPIQNFTVIFMKHFFIYPFLSNLFMGYPIFQAIASCDIYLQNVSNPSRCRESTWWIGPRTLYQLSRRFLSSKGSVWFRLVLSKENVWGGPKYSCVIW